MASPINELITPDAAIQTRPSTASPRPPFVALGFEAEVLPVARTSGLVSAALAVLSVIPVTATVLLSAADVPDAVEIADEEDVDDPTEMGDAMETPAGTLLAKDGGALATAFTRAPVPQLILEPSGCVVFVGAVVVPEGDAIVKRVVH